MSWMPYENGKTLNTPGSENGKIVQDEEHSEGARITLERDADHAPFAITCGIYGWFFHTRYIGTYDEAETAYVAMKAELATILRAIPLRSDADGDSKMSDVCDAISAFADRYP